MPKFPALSPVQLLACLDDLFSGELDVVGDKVLQFNLLVVTKSDKKTWRCSARLIVARTAVAIFSDGAFRPAFQWSPDSR